MKIIRCYRGDRSACHFMRIFCPFGKLSQRHKEEYTVYVSSVITKEHLSESCDLIVLQRQHTKEVYDAIIAMKQKYKPKLVYEIDDDLFNIPDWNPAKAILGVKSVQDGIKRFLGIVDAMFVSTEYLVDIYKNYCEKIYVLPNSINLEFFYPSPKNSVKKIVCWQGSMTHYKDIAVAEKSFTELAKNKDILFKLWCGFDKEHKPLFNFPGAYVLPLVPFEAFYAMFSQIDGHVGLAPLSTVPFNRSKSNLKFLEYAAQDMVTIASNFGPYKETIEDGVTGILISDNRDWYDATMDLINNDDKRNTILQNAKKVISEKYNIEINYTHWKNAIEEILERKENG